MLEQMRRVGIEPTTYTNNRRDGQPASPAAAQDAAPEPGAKRARTLPPNATETQSAGRETLASGGASIPPLKSSILNVLRQLHGTRLVPRHLRETSRGVR